MAQKIPVIFNDVLKEYRPVVSGDTIDPAYISSEALISGDLQNILTVGSDKKLFASYGNVLSDSLTNLLHLDSAKRVILKSTDIISADDGNGLKRGSDDKLFSPGLSVDPYNSLRKGNDGGFYISAKDLISTEAMNPFCIDCHGKLRFDTSILPQPQRVVSGRRGNLLKTDDEGAAYLITRDMISEECGNLLLSCDTKLFLGFDDVVSSITGNLIHNDGTGRLALTVSGLSSAASGNIITDKDGQLFATASLAYDNISGRLDLIGTQGIVLSTVRISPETSLLKSARVVTNPAGQPSGTYIEFVFQTETGETTLYANTSSLRDVYTAGSGIAISDQTISVKCGTGLMLDGDAVAVNLESIAGVGLERGTNPVTGQVGLSVKLGDGIALNGAQAVSVNIRPNDQLLAIESGVVTSFVGIRARHVADEDSEDVDLLELFDRNGETLPNGEVILNNGLVCDDHKLSIDTLDAVILDDKRPVNSNAVLDAIEASQGVYDEEPTEGSEVPVKSNGIYTAMETLRTHADESDEILANRITEVGTFDVVPTAGSERAVQSGGVKQFVDDVNLTLSEAIDTLSDHVDEIEARDIYKVKVDSDSLHPFFLTGSLTAGGSGNSSLVFDPRVYIQDGVLRAEKFTGVVDGSKIEGDVTAKQLKSSSFVQPVLTSDRRTLTAPTSGADSFRVWGTLLTKDTTTGTEEPLWVCGTFDKGATIVQLEPGYEIEDPTDYRSGYSYRNLNVLPLERA